MAPVTLPEHHRLWIGTGGYSYNDWVGLIYPPALEAKDYLAEYAKYFPLVELNFTYHRMPAARSMARMLAQAPSLKFSVKVNSRFTHQRDVVAADFAEYSAGIAPLMDAGALVAVLVQFPNSFHKSSSHLSWIEYLRDGFPDLPLVVEFRSAEWVDSSVTQFLRRLNIGWCAVDEPPLPELMRPAAAITADICYARFHGRNGAHWFEHEESWERHDYLYPSSELLEWIPKIERMVEHAETTAVVFANVCWGQGIENAQMLLDLLPTHLKERTVLLDPPRRISTRESRPMAIAAHYAKRDALKQQAASRSAPGAISDKGDDPQLTLGIE